MKKIIFILLVSLFVFNQTTKAQNKKFHAVFIYNFYKLIEWPANYRSGDFVIGVLGDTPLIASLQSITATKTAGYNKFVIQKYKSVADIQKCHMLFIPDNKSAELPSVLTKLNGKATLVITEKAGLAGQGSFINFVEVNQRLKFEINEAAIKKAGLQISSTLLNLGILI